MEAAITMDENLGRSGSFRAAMSIFGESINGRKADKNRGTVPAQENLSSEMKQLAQSGLDKLNERKAYVDKERAGAESELSRARAMAKELERQIEQTTAKATSQRSELQAMWAARTRRKGTDAPGAERDARYAEVVQELDQAKKELLRLRLEVRLRAIDEMKRRVDEANEEHVLVELARIEAERERREIEAQRGAEAERFAADIEAARARVRALQKEASRAREMEAKLAVTNSDVEVLQAEMELVRAMEKSHAKSDEAAEDAARRKKEEAQDKALLKTAEAELDAAKKELETIKAGSFQFMTSMDCTRTEIMRVAEEIRLLKAKEKKADAQVQQLNTKLLKAKARLEAVTAADERSKAIVSNLAAAMKQLKAETEAARMEEDLTKLEKRCVIAEAENIEKEIATTEGRIKQSVKELDAAKALEAEAMRKLRDTVESTMQARASSAARRQGTMTISRFEYEYLTGRAALVRVVTDKKVAAAQAWVQALKASEKEAAARAEAAEREVREMEARAAQVAAEAEKTAAEQKELEQELYDLNAAAERDGLQCAYPRRRSSRVSATSRRSKPRRSSVSAGAWNPRSPSFTIKRKRKVMPNLLKLIKNKRGGKKNTN
ncbi:Os01g0692300 [Oryza sativa Japonica Group]|uniref:Os01g0692300 protein n=2 Tax=Oryza sativa subsp. japonica TaxID=39947 RepID=A0A0P0V6W4_ORYSJ|nr:Os01g0692300 [Oryza sativa Japonica Group]BAS73816.1 Os01g0692300 [Oryza sativa Japonica Group]|eukprot:NP_001043941.2 Os01g0692300 [Oryza sativa Japonica Group]